MRFASVASLAVLAAAAAAVGGLALRNASAVASGEAGGSFSKETVWKTLSMDEDEDAKGKYPTSVSLSFEGNSVSGFVQYENVEGWPTGYELSGYCGNGRVWLDDGSGASFVGTIRGEAPNRVLKLEGRVLFEGGITEMKFTARESIPEER
jgi:hypothetical protein